MSSLARILTILAVLAVGLLAGGALVWYLAYGVEQQPPETLQLGAVSAAVQIDWGEQGAVAIDAQTLDDAMAALGYAHGWQRAWSVILWRQAALGRLSEWFGEPALLLDRLTHRLALAAQAGASYTALADADRAMLDAYTAGLNAALQNASVRFGQEFVLLGAEVEPWQPWHTLALERLFAWLAAPPPPPDVLAATGAEPTAFYEADRALRRWLHIHGFENSIAWVAQDTAGTHFFQRHVYGDTALPFFQEVALRLHEGPTTIWGASLPGTPFLPAGKTDEAAWALLLTTTTHLERILWQPEAAEVTYRRILSKDNTEHLLTFQQMDGRLPFVPPAETMPPDTVWSLRWAGLTPQSDLAAWRGLLTGDPVAFRLFDGHGLWVSRDGSWRLLGTPRVVVPFPSGTFVGSSSWSQYAGEFLRTQASGPVALEAWISDAYSIWAAETAPPLVNVVRDPPATTAAVRDAITYLRNWDYAYDRASIAASIFDRWMTLYAEATGTPFSRIRPDSATAPVLRETLHRSLAVLTEAYGPDQSQWRWERIYPDRRYFPIWSVEALQEADTDPGARARFAAVDWPGRGHPSALAWGPSSNLHTRAAPAAWEMWHHTGAWPTLTLRRRHLDPHAPLGRYLISDGPPTAITLPTTTPPTATTTLMPSSP